MSNDFLDLVLNAARNHAKDYLDGLASQVRELRRRRWGVSVTNWVTSEEDIARSAAAILKVYRSLQ